MLTACQSQDLGILVQPVALDRRCLGSLTYEQACRNVLKIKARIARATEAGDRKRVRSLERALMHSRSAKYVAAHEANAKLKPNRRKSRHVVRATAAALNLWGRVTGAARVRAIPKSKGSGYRAIVDYGLEERAAQWLVREVVRPHLQIRNDQFAVKHGGQTAACRRVAELIALGCAYAAEMDIKSCYPNLAEDGVRKLLGALPRRVVEARCLARGGTYHLVGEEGQSWGPMGLASEMGVGRGLSQGSLCSPLIAEAAVASVLDEVERRPEWPRSVRLVVQADNIAILSGSKAAVALAIDILGDALERAAVGPLKARSTPIRSTARGFDYLSVHFRKRDGRISVEASPEARSRFLKKLATQLKDLSIPLPKVEEWARSWGASMDLRKDGQRLTRASRWVAWVLLHALGPMAFRGRDLQSVAAFAHRLIHNPGLRLSAY